MDNHSNGLQLLLSALQAGTIFVTAVVEAVEEEHQRKRPKQDQLKEPTPTRIQRRRGSVCQYKRDYLGKWKDYSSVVVGVTFYISIFPSFSNSTSKQKRQFLIHRTLYVTLSSLVVHHPYLAVTTFRFTL
jgi:hypothetical protein